MTGHHSLHQGAESLVSQLQAGQAAFVALLGEDPLRKVPEHPSPRSAWNKGIVLKSGAEEIILFLPRKRIPSSFSGWFSCPVWVCETKLSTVSVTLFVEGLDKMCSIGA